MDECQPLPMMRAAVTAAAAASPPRTSANSSTKGNDTAPSGRYTRRRIEPSRHYSPTS